MQRSGAFESDREVSDGRFVRQTSRFTDWVTAHGSSGYRAEPGRYHLYVGRACPWSQRTMIVRHLKDLAETIGISYVNPYRDERGWAFEGNGFVDDLHGWDFLAEAYRASEPAFEGRLTVPVLWDHETGRIVNNDSAHILRMLNSAWDEWGDATVDLYPEALRAEIDAINAWVYDDLNNGVYKAGFARSQEAYDEAFDGLARVGHAAALRPRLPHALPPQWPPRDGPAQPVGLHARALPAAGHRADHGDRRDQDALLHDARRAQPQAHHPPRATGLGPHGTARARLRSTRRG
jgi:hypothetical protein